MSSNLSRYGLTAAWPALVRLQFQSALDSPYRRDFRQTSNWEGSFMVKMRLACWATIYRKSPDELRPLLRSDRSLKADL